MRDVPVFEAADFCAECGGGCCKSMAGHYSPADFSDLSYDGLKREIEKGKIAIDWWENDEPEYYLRARHIYERVVCGSWGGKCVNLTPEGCALPPEQRPLACRSLEPIKHGTRYDCHLHYSKEECKNDWKPYADVLEQVVEYFAMRKD